MRARHAMLVLGLLVPLGLAAAPETGDVNTLTATEFDLLRFMMRNPRRVLSREEILQGVWNYSFGGKTSIVDLYISYLRKKIDVDRDPMINTVRGVGYQLRPR